MSVDVERVCTPRAGMLVFVNAGRGGGRKFGTAGLKLQGGRDKREGQGRAGC